MGVFAWNAMPAFDATCMKTKKKLSYGGLAELKKSFNLTLSKERFYGSMFVLFLSKESIVRCVHKPYAVQFSLDFMAY